MKRKSPHRHKVQSHTRRGKPIQEFERGKGQRSQRSKSHKVVGKKVAKRHGLTEFEFDVLRRIGESEWSASDSGIKYDILIDFNERRIERFPKEGLDKVEDIFEELEEKGLIYPIGYDYNFYRITDKARAILGMDVPPSIPVEFSSAYAGKEFKHDVIFEGKAIEYLTDGKSGGLIIPGVYPPMSGEFIFQFCGLDFVAHGEGSTKWDIHESKSGRRWSLPVKKTIKGRLSKKRLKRFGLDKPDSELSEVDRELKEMWTTGRKSPVDFGNKFNILRRIVSDILVPLRYTKQFEFTDVDRYAVRIENLKPISYETTSDGKFDGRIIDVKERSQR